MKNKIGIFTATLLIAFQSTAQKAWMVPEEINPEDSVTIYVDIKKCDCQRLLGSTDPVYLWTWLPADRKAGDPTANGDWTASNETLKMKSEGNDIWSFKLVPTKFYGVSATTVYEKDFHFLIKKKDGTGAGGGGCNEDKTEDLKIEVDPPKSGPQKVKSFPSKMSKDTMPTSQNDVFTLIYDNNIEEKSSLKDQTDFYVFVQAIGENNTTYVIENITKVGTNPNLAMENLGKGIFQFMFIPTELFGSKLPTGVKIKNLRFQIVRQTINSSDDAVDGIFEYVLNNTCD